MAVYENALQMVGGTPLLKASRFLQAVGGKGEIFAKMEMFNPAGSIKDRIALAMVENAEKNNMLKLGGTVIEPTSGNTGIGLGLVCAVKGYKLILTMPSSMSEERLKILRALGATVVLTPANKGMQGAVEKAFEIKAQTENSVVLSQFDNLANPNAHSISTAKEIFSDMQGNIDCLIASVGTGGTLSGVAKTLKANIPTIKVIAVEPSESPLLSQNKVGSHNIQGIGANFIPNTLDVSIIDDIMTASTEQAYEYARKFALSEGVTCGISSGASLYCATKYLSKNEGKRVVVILPDGGEKYLSTPLFE